MGICGPILTIQGQACPRNAFCVLTEPNRQSFSITWLNRNFGLSPQRAALIASLAGLDHPGGWHE